MITNKESNFVSAVVYIYNNEDSLLSFLERLYAQLNEKFSKYEIVCVNDSSTDNSAKILKDFSNKINNGIVSLVNMSFHQGMELSMNAGVDLSIGDFVFEFDYVDNSVPVEKMFDVYKHSLTGFDVVSVAPKGKNRLSANLFYKIFNTYSHQHYLLRTETFRIISRRAINRCQAMSKTIPYRKAVYADAGLKMDTIFYETNGPIKNKQENNIQVHTALDALILFTNASRKLILGLMIVFMLACLGAMGYVVSIYLNGHPVSGWTTSMLFMSFGFFSLFFVFGIMMKYLSVIIDLIFKNKTYVTESIEKLTK